MFLLSFQFCIRSFNVTNFYSDGYFFSFLSGYRTISCEAICCHKIFTVSETLSVVKLGIQNLYSFFLTICLQFAFAKGFFLYRCHYFFSISVNSHSNFVFRCFFQNKSYIHFQFVSFAFFHPILECVMANTKFESVFGFLENILLKRYLRKWNWKLKEIIKQFMYLYFVFIHPELYEYFRF